MNPKGVAKVWADQLGGELDQDERDLIQHMTSYILSRWKARAQNDPDPENSFRAIYQREKGNAIGLICAIVEASRATADGRNPRDEMVSALERKTVH